jgi:phosphatidylglycerol:prolipoprotein diacylglycerol transferase
VNAYPLWVAAGIGLAAVVAARQAPTPGLDADQRTRLSMVAVVGAVAGAYLLQLPADIFGWNAPPPLPTPRDVMPMGGRTVLGGLLGGWIAVDVAKWLLRISAPSGDGFALPLAIALALGRLGCASAGCCAGQFCDPAWWAWHDATGQPRLPIQYLEAFFHAGMAMWLWQAGRRHWAGGRRLAIYLTLYAVVRFTLEFVREHPPVVLGLSWYQWLAVGLCLLAGLTWWRRSVVAVPTTA